MMNRLTVVLLFSVLLNACATSSTYLSKSQSIKASDANTQLGAAYLGQGDYKRANTKLEKAIQQNPSNAEAHNTYALLQMRLKQYDKAQKSFSKALSLEPKNSSILNNYGTFLCETGEFKKAQEKFALALQDPLYTTPEYAYTNAGICMLKQNRVNKAEAYFRTALKRSPKYTAAIYQMALVNERKKQYALAWNYMERLYKLNATKTPDNLWTAIRLSRVLRKRNSEAKYSSLLKNRYPDSAQTALMMRKFQ